MSVGNVVDSPVFHYVYSLYNKNLYTSLYFPMLVIYNTYTEILNTSVAFITHYTKQYIQELLLTFFFNI